MGGRRRVRAVWEHGDRRSEGGVWEQEECKGGMRGGGGVWEQQDHEGRMSERQKEQEV